MKNHQYLAGLTGIALFAILGTLLLFQNTTISAQVTDMPTFIPARHERFLAREDCKFVDAMLDLKYKDCEMMGRLQCNQAYGIPSHRGDAYIPAMNCLTQCIRDIQAQCEHASSAFIQEGKR